MLLSNFHLTKLIPKLKLLARSGMEARMIPHGSKCLINFRYSRLKPHKKHQLPERLVLHGQFAFGGWSWKEVRNGLQKTSFRCHANEVRRSQLKPIFGGEFRKGCQLARYYLLQDLLVDKKKITTVPFRLTLKSFLFPQVAHCMVVFFAATMLGCHKDSASKSHW